MLTISHFLISNTNFSRILSFPWQSFSGTISILTFRIQWIFVFSKTAFLNLLDLNQAIFFEDHFYHSTQPAELSHLHKHKFKYNIQNYLNSFCSCGSDIESISDFVLPIPIFNDTRHTLLNILGYIDCKISESIDSSLT